MLQPPTNPYGNTQQFNSQVFKSMGMSGMNPFTNRPQRLPMTPYGGTWQNSQGEYGKTGTPLSRPTFGATPRTGSTGMINAYNQQMEQWKQQQAARAQQAAGGQLDPMNSLMQQGQNLLMQDIGNNNLSNQLQFTEGANLRGELNSLVNGMDNRIVGQANSSADLLEGKADSLDQLGQKGYDEWKRFSQGSRKDLIKGLEGANAIAGQAVATAQSALANYKDMSAQQISAAVGGMANDYQSKIQQIQGGLDASGNQMTQAEVNEQMGALRSEWSTQRQQVSTQINSMVNERVADLTNRIADVQMFQSQTKQQGALGLGQQDVAFGGQMLDAQRQRTAMKELSLATYQVAEGMRNQAQVLSVDRQMQGMQLSGQLLAQFPFSPTSMFDAMLSLATLREAGGAQQQGFQGFPGYGPQGQGGQSNVHFNGQPMQQPGMQQWSPMQPMMG